MSLDAAAIDAIFNAAESHALASGLFDRVGTHEPKNAPGNGLSAALWVQNIAPVPSGSGLASTTGRLQLNLRIYSGMLQEPQDAIDPNMTKAVSTMFAAYASDFELGGNVRNVDLHGQAGDPLSAEAGYINIDGKLYRVMTITLPLIVNDCWDQVG